MRIGKLSIALAAVALATAPALAQAAFAPAIAPLNGDESEITETAAIVFGIGAAAAIVLGIVILSEGEEEPVSF